MFQILYLFFVGVDGFRFPSISRLSNYKLEPLYKHRYPYSNQYYEQYIKRLNSKNITMQHDTILSEGREERKPSFQDFLDDITSKHSELFDQDQDQDQENTNRSFDYELEDDDVEDEDNNNNYPSPIFIIILIQLYYHVLSYFEYNINSIYENLIHSYLLLTVFHPHFIIHFS